MVSIKLFATVAAMLAPVLSVRGHGYLTNPNVTIDGFMKSANSATIDRGTRWGPFDHLKYGYGSNATLSYFADLFASKGYNSLGEFIVENQKLETAASNTECGLTLLKESERSKLPTSDIEFSEFNHIGPCEVWCDKTKVLFANNCQNKYPGAPAKVPFDHAKCANANRMTIYWLAMHGDPWQVYVNCAWLQGGKGRGSPPVVKGQGPAKKGAGSKSVLAITPSNEMEKVAKEADGMNGSENETREETEPPSIEASPAKCSRRRE